MAIEINTAEEFTKLYSTYNGTSSKAAEVVLTADLDFTGVDFSGFGETNTMYISLDGQGHTIKNMTINVMLTNSTTWIFWKSGCKCTIKNLKFSNNTIVSTTNITFFHFASPATLSNVIIDNTNIMTAYDAIRVFQSPRATSGAYLYEKVFIAGIYTCKGFYGITANSGTGYSGTAIIRECTIMASITTTGACTLFNARYHFNSFARSIIIMSGNNAYCPFDGYQQVICYCYAANTVTATESASNTSDYWRGLTKIDTSGTVYYSYYDKNLFQYEVPDSAYGQTTENLKSDTWLRSQRWPI